MKGWNYTVRLYRPRAEILDGTWKFPGAAARAVNDARRDVKCKRRPRSRTPSAIDHSAMC